MISIAVNALTSIMEYLNAIEIKSQVALEDLPCRVTEINETQDYNVPSFPVESGQYKGDTIYKLPLKLQVRLFVKSKDYTDFEAMLNEINFSQEFISIKSLNGKYYQNMKIVQWARDTNASMMGAVYYNVALQEMILVEALTAAKPKKAGYGKSTNGGNKEPQEQKSSAFFKLTS